jgi:hypothetical protein
MRELVRCARGFQHYLSSGIEEFCKPLPAHQGTVYASREIIAKKLLIAQSKGDKETMKELKYQQESRDKRTYMFDCLLKSLLLIIDGVLNDREEYAYDEKSRFIRLLDEEKKRSEK